MSVDGASGTECPRCHRHTPASSCECVGCPRLDCTFQRAELARLTSEYAALKAKLVDALIQLREVVTLSELQQADLERYKKAAERNQPERADPSSLQLAFEEVIKDVTPGPARDAILAALPQREAGEQGAASSDASSNPPRNPDQDQTKLFDEGKSPNPSPNPKGKRGKSHGRRDLRLEDIPVERIRIDPDEVIKAAGEGFEYLGEEISYRLGFRPASFVRLEISRSKWLPKATVDRSLKLVKLSAEDSLVADTASPNLSTDSDDSSSCEPAPIVGVAIPGVSDESPDAEPESAVSFPAADEPFVEVAVSPNLGTERDDDSSCESVPAVGISVGVDSESAEAEATAAVALPAADDSIAEYVRPSLSTGREDASPCELAPVVGISPGVGSESLEAQGTVAVSALLAAAGHDPDISARSEILVAHANGDKKLPRVLIAPLPDGLWERCMADPSTIAQAMVGKYEDVLPLHRQERISERHGFTIPRSTLCGWFGLSYDYLYRIHRAMMDDAIARSFCIGIDATGAPVRCDNEGRILDQCARWHVFVLIADMDYVLFQYSPDHDGKTVRKILKGYTGNVLADAASVYDIIYRDDGMTEIGCWAHLRRYFWKALLTDRDRGYQVLSIIAKLYVVDRECAGIPMPERTEIRAARAKPLLDLLDAWVEQNRKTVDARSPMAKAIGYYDNQREALREFLKNGRLRLDNNLSEQALRYVVVGRSNWKYFENETGLKWFTVFRSLIATCRLHRLNPQTYLEQVLRLAPHWPVNRVLELSPKHWAETVSKLDDHQRAIITPPWELPSRVVTTRAAAA